MMKSIFMRNEKKGEVYE